MFGIDEIALSRYNTRMDGAFWVNTHQVRDIRHDVLGPDGRIRILPAAFWETTSVHERIVFGSRTGIYSFPTTELVEYLREIIAGRSAIEIGAGHGVLAEALAIPGTDSYQQQLPRYRTMYEQNGVAIVPYGPQVVAMPAWHAVRHYKPEVVIGCWVTHKYDPRQHERGGNEVGIDEADILRNCVNYVLVGHEYTHRHKPIWTHKHTIEFLPFVYSRAMSAGRNFVAVFEGLK